MPAYRMFATSRGRVSGPGMTVDLVDDAAAFFAALAASTGEHGAEVWAGARMVTAVPPAVGVGRGVKRRQMHGMDGEAG